MIQDKTYTFTKALRAVLVAAMMLLTGGLAIAQVTVNGNVYGGGNAADVGANATVNITYGTMVNVYGGGKGENTTVVGDVTVNIGKFTKTTTSGDVIVTGVAAITGSVYGGSALGTVNSAVTKNEAGTITGREPSNNKSTSVNIYRSTINGSVYGGGEGDNTTEAQVCKGVTVTIGTDDSNDNPTIAGSVYGGCNANGVLWEKSEVNVVRGTIGTMNEGALAEGTGNVHGGGFGQKTLVQGDVEVNIGASTTITTGEGESQTTTTSYSGAATIYGDVYGGSAKGNVNAKKAASYTAENPTYEYNGSNGSITTAVNLYGGTVSGNVYGGGLGDADHAANVFGAVTVNVGAGTVNSTTGFATKTGGSATIRGSVYGCNNVNGSPKDNVTVNIYQTAHNTTNVASYRTSDETNGAPTYALANVFGGGNKASYAPEGTDKSATVHVYSCDNTIGNVFGGGDAAAAYGVVTIIDGGRFGRVFGGGNGEVTAANIGAGGTDLTVHGGYIGQLFAGSNERGSISGDMNVTVDNASGCGEEIVDYFGGSNMADLGSAESPITLNTVINCGAGTFRNVYGGCNLANIIGDVTLSIYGGTYTNVFGGSKGRVAASGVEAKAANITGNVTLNLYGGTMDNAFGGSDANGNITGKITVNMLDQESSSCGLTVHNIYGGGRDAAYNPTYTVAEGETRLSPEVNLIHGTVSKKSDGSNGNVFGGGLGSTATVSSNPKVTVGYVSSLSSLLPSGLTTVNVTVEGDVYGGGEEAAVSGSTSVTVQQGTAQGMTISTAVNGDVYGGGALANVGTDANNSTEVTITGGTVSNVYGGGLGRAAVSAVADNPDTPENEAVAAVEGIEALVNGAVTVTIDGGTISNVYGCNNYNGRPTSTVTVNINNSVSGNVFGGGNLATATCSPIVNITAGTVNKVFGGGNEAGVGGSTVNVNGGTITAGLYGGCNTSGTVTGTALVTLSGGTVGTSGTVGDLVFGGGFGHGTTTNTATVNVGTATTTTGETPTTTYSGNANIYSNVYGGSALGTVGTATVNLNSATNNNATTLAGQVFGGGMGNENTAATISTSATVWQNNVTMASGKNIYGGCNVNGTAAATNVYVMGGTSNSVFGGGLGPNTGVSGNVSVNVGTYDSTNGLKGSGTVTGNVYGGSAQGTVNAANADPLNTTTVNLWAGTINGDVYGGGLGDATHSAAVNGKTRVNLNGDATYTSGNGTCVVKRYIFGGNDTNGSPAASEVHIYKTIDYDAAHTRTITDNLTSTTATDHKYNLAAVYGGGNLATFTGSSTKVVIETCDPSIETVYGGGNAADANDTWVEVKGAYEIGTVFGGGNGADNTKPAANVNGKTEVYLHGGTIHEAYGGSNTNGDVTGGTNVTVNDNNTSCSLKVDHIYGGGKNASMGSGTNIVLGCQPDTWIEDIYAGSREADVNGDVSLTITSGKFERVFGGNKTSGKLKGAITVNIEETGSCSTPIIIGELYAGGNVAHYSTYGYKDNGDPMTADDLRTELTTRYPDKTEAEIEELFQAAKKADPQLNVRAFTSIGAIYGGGLSAEMYANPTVSINVVKGSRNATVINEGQYTPSTAPFNHLPYPAHAAGTIGTIGNVFGGGNLATVHGDVTVNIGTETAVDFVTEPAHLGTGKYSTRETSPRYTGVAVEGANITGSVYGGGNLANVTGDTQVNICAKKNDSDVYESVTPGTAGVTIGGDVFGAGKGSETNISAALVEGNSNVYMGNGWVKNNVYGGGSLGAVGTFTSYTNAQTGSKEYTWTVGGVSNVTIAGGMVGPETMDPTTVRDKGNVFGAGKGSDRLFECESAMVKQSNVVISNGTVKGTVYGGGEVGRVETNTSVTIGTNLNDLAEGETSAPDIRGSVFGAGKGLETHGYSALVRGNSTVTVQGNAKVGLSIYGGGEIASVGRYKIVDGLPTTPVSGGVCTVTVRDNAEIGPDNMRMVTESGYPDDTGYIFGGGKGVLPRSGIQRMNENNALETYTDEDDYTKYVMTLALASDTHVTVDGNAFVKGSVYGGSENGYVQRDTHVTIAGGQIGCGRNTTQRHKDAYPDVWDDDYTPSDAVDLECDHWPYQSPYAPYDIYKFQEGSTTKPQNATDGHTFYGNVFGGGSGYFPYAEGPELTQAQIDLGYSKGVWHRPAGSVGRNTVVDITGGHILTSVYGGNEQTDVTGSCTINMTGGTVGVPRTVAQMQAHPVTCYVFGAGKGDPRINFNTWTNVARTQVNISGNARIYGSTFGGGEDGHVLGNAVTNIGGDVTIGTGDDAATTGHTNVIIGTTGTSSVDGNIFGGGRGFSENALTAGVVGGDVNVNIHNGKILGSVFGGGRLASVGTYFANAESDNYGKMQDDSDTESHGHINITIDGGTIGATDSDGKLATSTSSIGDVFGGSKGTNNDLRFGLAKTTTITMSGGKVKGSVYGGGEVAMVEEDATIAISGGEVGDGVTAKGGAKIGNVYGGGKGNTTAVDAGLIKGNTTVTINPGSNGEPKIYHNIYGGGAYGSVGTIARAAAGATYVPGKTSAVSNMPTSWARRTENTGTDTGTAEVYVYGGTIGINGDENGMVFGSSRGDVTTPGSDNVDPNDRTAWVYDTKVVIGNTGETGPTIKGSVYGSGENGHVFTNTQVGIHSGIIGVTDDDAFGGADYRLRGNVYGGGCGEDTYPNTQNFNPLAGIVLGNANVNIDGGLVVHNVYGAGALGSVTGKTTVTIKDNAIIGVEEKSGGNVYGAARGKEGATVMGSNLANSLETEVNINGHSTDNTKAGAQVWGSVYGGGEAGNVKQSVLVSMTGGAVAKDVYGGGALADTQTNNWDATNNQWANATNTSTTYTTQVNLTGGTIGRSVYGGALGRKASEGVTEISAKVYGDVTVSLNDNDGTCQVNGNVFGCNNANGTPKGNVVVNVYDTKGSSDTKPDKFVDYTEVSDDNLESHTFELTGVYGGGNLATYSPESGKITTVNIYGCDKSSIKEVYGGGSAADVPGTTVNVYGAYEIGYVFAGGNGTSGAANVNGNATTTIHGGTVYRAFAGANTSGDITGTSRLNIADDNTNETCALKVGDVFSYGNHATMSGQSVLNLGCLENKVGALYGGAMNADIGSATSPRDIVMNINGGKYHQVFGGNKASGTIFGSIKVNIEQTTDCPIEIDELYGCGNNAAYTTANGTETPYDDPEINIISCQSIGAVYGAGYGSGAAVTGNPKVNINMVKAAGQENLGTIGNVYGGGYGADVTGNTFVNIGTVANVTLPSNSSSAPVVGANITGDVFGGGYGHETNVSGTATINIGERSGSEGNYTYTAHGASFSNNSSIYGGSALGTVATTQVNLYAGTIPANVFGGGKGQLAATGQEALGATVTTSNVSLYNATVTGDIYGGCNDNGTTTTAFLNLIGGSVGTNGIGDKVFGGGKGHATTTTNATVNVGTSTTVGSSNIYSNVYGGSALGEVGTAIVNLNKATSVIGHVFGGGMGDASNAATVTTSATVNQNGVTLASGKDIYGGCNVNGTAATTTVNLIGGSVRDVFGGGLGQNTSVTGDVLVNVGTYENSAISGNPTITRDVYGGSAQGTVNKEETATPKTTKTTVHLYAGTVNGNVYGGGLGQKAREADAEHDITALGLIEAHVYGDVLVDLNDHDGTCAVAGGIFGCNNQAGSPKGHVTVHVYKTQKATGSTAAYDLASVYGGGNEADYEPNDTKLSTEVVIEGCNITSIQDVYGGGNAAAVPATEVWILGSKEIGTVFGGGNGERGSDYAANVGFASNGTAYTYGTGKAETKLVAGNVTTVYGGSNSNGDVRGGSWISMPQKTEYPDYSQTTTSCCDQLYADNIYGGGKNANMSGGTNIVLGCQPDRQIDEIYAGAQNADVVGDVSLTITSGKFGRVFGGNKDGGALKGSITVNVEETGGCDVPIVIGELYGGGNLAGYSVYGYDTDGNPIEDEAHKTVEIPYEDPKLNIRSFTSIGKVFGAGYKALMVANPIVNIDVVKGSHADDTNMHTADNNYTYPGGTMTVDVPATATTPAETLSLPYPAHKKGEIGAIGNVFGGGNLATVIGNATVNIGTESTVTFITEPAHLGTKGTTGQTLETEGVAYIQREDGLYEAKTEGANITENVYGGGNLADITGNTLVNICATKPGDNYVPVAEGAAKVIVGGHVFGGGKGKADEFTCAKAMVGIVDQGVTGSGTSEDPYVLQDGGTTVNIGNGTVKGNVYGGGEIGRVERNTVVTIGLASGTSMPVIEGSVFGAGAGVVTHGYSALVRGNSSVTVQGNAQVWQNVYGGGAKASVGRYNIARDATEAAAHHVSVGMPYGLKSGGTSSVTIQGHAVIGKEANTGHVYGAGQGIEPSYNNTPDDENRSKRMSMMNDQVYTYENKESWEYTDNSHQYVWEYFANKDAYLKYVETLAISASTDVNIDGDAEVKGSVFGGSENGFVYLNTDVDIQNGTIDGDAYGGGRGLLSYSEAGRVNRNTDLTVSGGTVKGNVYGGGNLGDVGTIQKSFTNHNYVYSWTTGSSTTWNNTGVSNVHITGGTIGDTDATKGNVFGAGKGEEDSYWCEKAMVYRANVTVSNGTVKGTVYGGGEIGRVEENTTVTIGADGGTDEFEIKGNVFGAGKGLKTHGYSALVRGNPTVTVQGKAKVNGNVYGGGEVASVARYKVAFTQEEATAHGVGFDMPYALDDPNSGLCTVTITGGAVIGTDGNANTGHVFGAGMGINPYEVAYTYQSDETKPKRRISKTVNDTDVSDWEYFGSVTDYLKFVETLALASNTVVTVSGSANVMGSVYGGSQSGFVQYDTDVKIQGGQIGSNVFGGGKGLASYAEAGRVSGNTEVAISNGTVGNNVYGGGELGDVGKITKNTDYNYTWKDSEGYANTSGNNKITGTNNNTGICKVGITGGAITGNVFGAGKGLENTWWCEKAIAYATDVSVSAGTVNGNVYGGGEVGRVEDDSKVVIGVLNATGSTAPSITGSVYGAGAGIKTHGYSALVRGNSDVTVQGTALVGGSVYGGGEIASVGRFKVIGGLPSKPQAGGTCTVTIQDNAKIGSDGTGHNVFGACKGVTPAWNDTPNDENRSKSMQLVGNKPSGNAGDTWDEYEDENGNKDDRFIWVYYPTEAAYLDFLKTLALTSNTVVTIDENANVYGDVYGGGERGITLGGVDVNMTGGTVHKDVYGGGSLADSNTAMWDATNKIQYDYVKLDLLAGFSHVTGYYTESNGAYTLITDENAKAVSGIDYYAKYKTNVNLTGGTIIGSAYGGGLGQKDGVNGATGNIEAMVYGDVFVDLNGTTTFGTNGKPTQDSYGYPTGTPTDRSSRGCVVNQVFGCNNLNGTPKGNVAVHVYGTQHAATSMTKISDKYNPPYYDPDKAANEGYKEYLQRLIDAAYQKDEDGNVITPRVRITGITTSAGTAIDAAESVLNDLSSTAEASLTDEQKTSITTAGNNINQEFKALYDVYAVYGGGNEAAYEPAVAWNGTSGSKTQVVIEGCDYTSIQYVYGGGNAAPVPETNLLIKGNKIIDNLFGGGNGTVVGADIGYKKDGTTNQGTGNVSMNLMAGYIHNVFNGSNTNGNIRGNVSRKTVNIPSQQSYQGECCSELYVNKFFGAGKNADIEGDLIDVIDCQQNTWIDEYYGGAENANVKGNVELTIHSGKIRKLFGGNKTKGAIFGHIILNIEETGNCAPIIIDELYGCGNDAAYSIYGYYHAKDPDTNELQYLDPVTKQKPLYLPRTAEMHNMNPTDPNYVAPAENPSNDDGKHPFPYDPPVLNIVSATHIGKVFGGGYGENGTVYGSPTVNINMIPGSHAVNGALGDIGDVYGGGNAAAVIGNTTVNICTLPKVQIHESVKDEGGYNMSEEITVVGANITGNVFGGGMGEATTFTCEKAMVGQDGDGEMVERGNTNVTIANGTIGGSVYGGGEIARVENNTVVTIGTGNGGTGSAPVIMGNVFGAGKGIKTHGYSALVRGTTTVTIQGDAKVGQSVYGGGEIASVGNFFVKGVTYPAELHAPTPPDDFPEGMPYALKYPDSNNGTCTVTIRGNAEIGPNDMTMPTFSGHVFGAGKGLLPEVYDSNNKPHRMIGGNADEYFASESKYIEFIETLGMSAATEVTIDGNAFVKGSVYGGSENGHVLKDTHVTIDGQCQIGNGYNTTTNKGVNQRYTDWSSESLYECAHWPYGRKIGGTDENPINEYLPYDVYDYVDPTATNPVPKAASDGHTFYGNVFGGGSGYFPYRKNPNWVKDEAKSAVAGCPVDANGYSDGLWLRSAGAVYGNTFVDIKNGHILTSVYGGNECTDVGKYQTNSIIPAAGTGHCTVNMVGGTIGVPRTEQQMKDHPVTCYLFGAGKGDQRINFNTWTNVASTQVNISGTARIYGSTFGGGEDGHVIGDAETNIGGTVTIGATSYSNEGVVIGTTGTSYVDGNVFGGGRGFSGDAQTAGTVGGNARLNIYGGTMLGSIYGGGRLASVGTQFSQPEEPTYGQFNEDDANHSYGHVTVNISGGTIGNTVGNAVSGNVFGGSMGRLTLLDNKTINPLWPELAQVKTATVNISGNNTLIKRNVYGGGEYGSLRENTYITIGGTRAANGTISPSGKPTISGNVFGGGYGSDDYNNPTTVEVHWNNATAYYTYTPMQWAGCVGGNTNVDIVGGKVKQNVYGGGQMASVGIIDYSVKEDNNGPFTYNNKKYAYKNIVKHADIVDERTVSEKVYGFGLSWPYEFTYVPCKPGTTDVGGKTTVTVSGGRIGADGSWDDGTGYVFGAGKGKAFERYTEAFCANVRESEVNIDYTTTADPADVRTADCIASAVYGGGEDGHVYENSAVNITGGLIGLSVYGGGKGEGTYEGKLRNRDGNHDWNDELVNLPSWTAGKVYGNTTVNMTGGHVLVNVYGGGNMGSVGKGNYASGTDDYYPAGYGETLYYGENDTRNQNLWTTTATAENPDNAWHFLNSGTSSVTITAGTIGTKNSVYHTVGGLDTKTPTGMVFGGSRGKSAEDIGALSPRYAFAPDFFLGYVNKTVVTIGNDNGGPTIYSQVFGGGRDGHVRNSSHVIINNGTIGQAYSEYNSISDVTDRESQRRNCGNVYASGSGMGTWDGTHHGTSSGSITRNATVDVNGGTIYGNVYGGGAMSSVGPPKIGADAVYAAENWSKCTVNINGGTIGVGTDFSTYGYGGCVFGASRGGDLTTDEFSEGNLDNYATTLWNEVNIKGGTIAGDVYGGGQAGRVKMNNKVYLTGGTVNHDVFGGGMGTSTIAANVGGDVLVTLNGTETPGQGGTVTYNDNAVVKGSVFGANNVNGTPEGHVTVHVFKTAPAGHSHGYDVTSVFGGGKKADYVPTDNVQSTEVIIEGCDLTSIEEVYGGGYGAATPGTSVLIKGTKIIDNVFGGGYGDGNHTDPSAANYNPGANVGYLSDGITPIGLEKDGGKAVVQLMAGTVNHVYGGSNSLGDIRGGSNVTSVVRGTGDVRPNCCTELNVQEIYGGGKQADMFGGAEIVLGCMPNDWIGAIYGGAANADVKNDVSLTLTSGKFGRVFGGNKSGGNIEGYIEVNIEENPDCSTPIIIGELYGGGDAAPYTLPSRYITENNPNYQSPRVNVRSFTSIGNVYGGGYGAAATVKGNPMVNINEVVVATDNEGNPISKAYDPDGDTGKPSFIDGVNVKLYPHEAKKIGVIGNVFGGGNAAKVEGNTYVNIGTTAEEQMVSLQTKDAQGQVVIVKKPVKGADIRGNVYGGGNAAEVTGQTNVVIGKEKVQ